jgi:predicted ATPase
MLASGARLLTLTGPPGVGKTSLALALAAELHARFADGAALVDLAAVTDPDQVAAIIADALGAPGRREPVGRLVVLLRRRDLLLLLDNFEQVVSAAPVVAELLAGCPDLTVLATSRIALRLRWERELLVPPLRLPDLAGPLTAAEVTDVPAVRLFVERAQAVSPTFALTDENGPAVAGVCARLDGLPLAIELAAARARLLTPAAMLRHLARADGPRGATSAGARTALGLLTDGPRDLPARQQTLRGGQVDITLINSLDPNMSNNSVKMENTFQP